MIEDDVYFLTLSIYIYIILPAYLVHMYDEMFFKFTIISNVYLILEKQLHLLMYLETLEYADIQCNQTHVPRDALSKKTLTTQDF